jgi:futalosine hydrolase
MRLLIVAATRPEIAPLLDHLGPPIAIDARHARHASEHHEVDVLIAGVGMVATAVWVTQALTRTTYDAAYNFGVCGAFDDELPIGSVVHVVSDRLSELGAEDGEAFLPIEALGLMGPDEFPFADGWLRNSAPPEGETLGRLPAVRGITVSTVHGRESSIAAVRARHQPQVESMEGAAFMYACHAAGVSHAQVRAISNRVERRNRSAWQMGPAIQALGAVARAIVEER